MEREFTLSAVEWAAPDDNRGTGILPVFYVRHRLEADATSQQRAIPRLGDAFYQSSSS